MERITLGQEIKEWKGSNWLRKGQERILEWEKKKKRRKGPAGKNRKIKTPHLHKREKEMKGWHCEKKEKVRKRIPLGKNRKGKDPTGTGK